MRMTFRWYGKDQDRISLDYIRHIPGVKGVVWSLHDKQAGEAWHEEEIRSVKEQALSYNLNIDVVESVNVHEDIKLGLASRDAYIENYIKTIRALHKFGVKVICYNFMPVFDWARTELFHPLEDGTTTLFYEKTKIENIDPHKLIADILEGSSEFSMPGWEPERLTKIDSLLDAYQNFTEQDIWDNLKYFLEAIIPVAQECDIKMAIHPDDPPWSIFGLPKIITNLDNLKRFLSLVDNPYNGLTFCTGSLGANPANDIPNMIREVVDRIHFAHIRNLKIYDNGDFAETSHRAQDGSIDIVEVIRAYHEKDFNGYIRPDHGRHIWSERDSCRPGYGLYDRALGIMYILGVWDSLDNNIKRESVKFPV